ncbi:MAG: MAPEG family protein [Xanthomonadales bacterium]|nr:MAPEG family protein [Xanthomonadales bacterium]
MRITGLYAALAALLIIFLAVRVMLRRKTAGVGIGDGGDHELAKRVRAHANAVEYVPIGLILLLILELDQTTPVLVHAFGITLVVGRVLHAFGLSKTSKISTGRALGIVLSALAITAMAVLLLWRHLVVALA